MQAIVERCCFLDIGQASLVSCMLVGPSNRKPRKEVRTFSTMTADLLGLREWLGSEGCTQVGMESTGVYWEPIYNILEGYFDLVVGNAQHIKNVPGRKTDVKDSEWGADLLRHGLIRKSFVPARPFRELRQLTRYRRKLVEERSAERNRVQKALETANVKLASVASDVFGVSGMLMLRAIIHGESNPAVLAEHAKGVLRGKIPRLKLALDGRVREHHRFILQRQLERLDGFEGDIAEVTAEIDRRLAPYQAQIALLTSIPGVDRTLASAILAEIGVDMGAFHSANHLAAWAGVCPGNNESAGRRGRTRARMGNKALTTALVEAGHSAGRAKGSHLRAKYLSVASRAGRKCAAMAVGHQILVAIYYMLKRCEAFRDRGEAHLDQAAKARTVASLVRRLRSLGFQVNLSATEPLPGAIPLDPRPPVVPLLA